MRDMEGLTEAQMQTMTRRERFNRTSEKQSPSAGQQTNDSGLHHWASKGLSREDFEQQNLKIK